MSRVTLPRSAAGLVLLARYGDSMQRVCGARKKGGATLAGLDRWFQTELPAALAQQEALDGEQMVKTMEWKLARGKWRPRLLSFVQGLAPEEVRAATSEALALVRAAARPSERESDVDTAVADAVSALTRLKGVGPATASAYLAAACPALVPFAEDSSLRLVLGKSKLDYSLAEIVEHARRLRIVAAAWAAHAARPVTAHDVELALFALHNLDPADADVVAARADGDEYDFAGEDGEEDGEEEGEGNHYDSATDEESEVLPVSKRARRS